MNHSNGCRCHSRFSFSPAYTRYRFRTGVRGAGVQERVDSGQPRRPERDPRGELHLSFGPRFGRALAAGNRRPRRHSARGNVCSLISKQEALRDYLTRCLASMGGLCT